MRNAEDIKKAGPGLSRRAERILAIVVREHIRSVRPVSSAAVARSREVGLGTASIRAVLSELEKAGYLVKDHSSSGRVPTDKSFRLYVDTLRDLNEPKPSEVARLTLRERGPLPIKAITLRTARALSSLTSCTSLLLMPGVKNFTIKDIKLVAINDSRVLVIIVPNSGPVHTSTVGLEAPISGLNLEHASNYLCSIGRGLTLRRLRARLKAELNSTGDGRDSNGQSRAIRAGSVAPQALKLGSVAARELERKIEKDIFLEGTALIFEQPEFKEDAARIKHVFAALEEKSLIIKILEASINDIKDNDINIHMGSEGATRIFDGLSFVTAPYGSNGNKTGMVGIVGPVRMDYPKIIPLVNCAARQLGRAAELRDISI
ncbi:Heat-inducible transcription repressor HrcA [hydrothermal vent metagenome]|uniref:Heat-inducible transcription repressor HrcA n=1 Tax=hydrothermal vent metagenome TaxID=652676 RepID=A0A3B0W5I0_9ZZZZ